MINIIFLSFCLASIINNQRVDGKGLPSTLKEDWEIERQLKLINKPPVKSIHTKFGYILDCIDINKQPAFDHPLLKNHKLQRKPSFGQAKVKNGLNGSLSKAIFGLERGSCPKGSVPIRRTTKEDLIRSKLLANTHILSQDNPGTHVAGVKLVSYPDQPFYGVSGVNSIYNPKVTKDQTSASHIWVKNGRMDATNKIMVGWHVSPQLHGDDETYLYSRWTADNFIKTGCYNIQCSGYVQIDPRVFVGIRMNNTSVYGGVMAELNIALSQDPSSKNWWLKIQNKKVGYFPAALFSNLTEAEQVGWGGTTTTPAGSPSPPMGSSYLPDDNFSHACYFIYVAFQNSSRIDYGPEFYRAQEFTDNSQCYGAKYYGYVSNQTGSALQFGGPGGNCGD